MGIFRKFSWLCYLYLQMWNCWVLFVHIIFLVFKLETLNCEEVKHIMIVILAIIYIFLSYMILDQQLKITFRKSSDPPENIHCPFLLTLCLKIQKVQVPPFCQHWKFFRPSPLQKGGGALCKGIFVIAKVLPIKEI